MMRIGARVARMSFLQSVQVVVYGSLTNRTSKARPSSTKLVPWIRCSADDFHGTVRPVRRPYVRYRSYALRSTLGNPTTSLRSTSRAIRSGFWRRLCTWLTDLGATWTYCEYDCGSLGSTRSFGWSRFIQGYGLHGRR